MNNCDCFVCKEYKLHPDLLSDFESGKVTVFAGSGISTESKSVLKFTFYDDIVDDLNLKNCTLSFPDLMEEYCSQPNGRIKLLSKIKSRFNHINSFPELKRNATSFHNELATLFPVKTIVTTNWDMYFEEACAAVPFVSDQDLVFWESEDRRVLKIHGSINNYGSIIATINDYSKSQKRLETGIIGGILKTLFATQTIIFIGYSLRDSDFIAIWNFVSKQMNGLQRQAFVITPFENEQKKIENLGLIPIIKDGSFFISKVKEHFVYNRVMLPDTIYSEAEALLLIVIEQHDLIYDNFNCSDYPQIIIAASYQDGLIHALERAISLRGSGEYSQPWKIRAAFKPYQKWQKEKLKAKKYEDVAYIEGYLNGLTFLLLDEKEKAEIEFPPLYFAFGTDALYTIDDYKSVINELPKLHKASYLRAKKMVDRLSSSNGMVFHHPAWL